MRSKISTDVCGNDGLLTMDLREKVKGALVGFAYGDAIGLGTEFMSAAEVKAYYPNGLHHFSEIINDAHRSQFEQGSWSNDTEIVVRMLENVLEHGEFDIASQAKALRQWRDEVDFDVTLVHRMVLQDPEWVKHPLPVCHKVWVESGMIEATGEATARGLVTALVSDAKTLDQNTRRAVLMTHDDTRCVSTGVLMAHICHSLLHNDKDPEYAELEFICKKVDPRTLPFLRMAWEGDIAGIDPADEDTLAWTRKILGAALWGYWHYDNPEDIIHNVVNLGGDADTSGSLAGALAGLKYGYSALPEEVKKLKRLDYLLDLADRVADYIERNRK